MAKALKVSFEIVEDKNASVSTFKLRAREEGRKGQPRILATGPTSEGLAEFQTKLLAKMKEDKVSKNAIFDKAFADRFERVSLFEKVDGRGRKREFDGKLVGGFSVTMEMLARLQTVANTKHKGNMSDAVRAMLDIALPNISECKAELDKLLAVPATDESTEDKTSDGSETPKTEDSTETTSEDAPKTEEVVTEPAPQTPGE